MFLRGRPPGQIDGWQIAERYREHNPQLPVIYEAASRLTAARPVSGSIVPQKPYFPDDIIQAVKQMTSGRSL